MKEQADVVRGWLRKAGSDEVAFNASLPYAVQLRYDADFWPGHEVAEEAGLAVSKVRDFVISLLPEELTEA